MARQKDYFSSRGSFTNIDIPELEGDGTTELTANVAWSTEKINKLLEDYSNGLIDIKKVHNSPFLNNDPNQRRPRIAFSYTAEEMAEMKKCATDIVYFADKYCKLLTDDGYINVKIRDYQQGILHTLSEEHRVMIMASRQTGKTTTTGIYILWYLLFNKDKTALVVGNKWRTSEEILNKIKETLTALPFFMKRGILVSNTQDMTFDNGSRIVTTAPGKSASIGFTINLLYMDEFAHIPAQFIGPFWRSVYPTVSSMKDSRIVISSTPNGQNMFWEMWCAAVEKKSGFCAIRVDWWQVPGRDEEWKRKTLLEFSPEFFNQEYNLQFFKGDNLLLDSNELKLLNSVKTKFVSRHIECLNVQEAAYVDMKKVFTARDFSKYMDWNPSFLKRYFGKDYADLKHLDDYFVLSIDTSKGITDYHVLNIFKVTKMSPGMLLTNRASIADELDIFSLVQVGKFRFNEINIETFSNIVSSICFKLFNSEKIFVLLELNQQGVVVRSELERHSAFWDGMIIYTKQCGTGNYEPGIDLSNNKYKLSLCEDFKHRVITQRIIPTDEATYGEVSNFGTNEKRTIYRCQTGHDDLAMSCIHCSSWFDSMQYAEVCVELFDNIKDAKYKEILEREVIEYNRVRLGENSEVKKKSLIFYFNN